MAAIKMRHKLAAVLVVALLCVLSAVHATEMPTDEEKKWGELAQLLMNTDFGSMPRHDWDTIDVEESPFLRASEANQNARSPQDSAVTQGIMQSANFRFPKTLSPPLSSSSTPYFYSRVNNPNFDTLERQISALYDVRHRVVPKFPNDMVAHLGVDPLIDARHPAPKAVTFASGMGAIAAVAGSILKSGDKMIIADDLYYEVEDLGKLLETIGDIKTIVVDISDIDKVAEAAADSAVKILYMESASNPHGRIPDFDPLIARVRSVNSDIIVVVDNTWTTSVVFQPFRHDVDVVVESGTKYLSGKGDAVLGVAVVYQHAPVMSTASDEQEELSENRRNVLAQLPSKMRSWRRLIGSNPAPMNAWLVSKGLETLQLRVRHLSIKTPEVADLISTLPPVTRVHQCGMPSHPHFHLAETYFDNAYCGGILTFHLPLKSEEEVEQVMRSSAPFVPAPSFGEAHTLVMWPRKGSSRNFPGDEERGIPNLDGYWFRLSLGLADSEEIKRDFFRWMTRIPSLTTSLASVDHDAFSREKETGNVVFTLAKADWQSISLAPSPLFIKRQELADIDESAPKTHAIPVALKIVREISAHQVELTFETARPAHVASYISHPGKYIISAFKSFVAK